MGVEPGPAAEAMRPPSEQVSARMSRQKTRDTLAEVSVRRTLFARGLRFRVNYPVPRHGRRTIDIAFPRVRVAVFIDGCFWHGCPVHGTIPHANTEWWMKKIQTNRARDSETSEWLEAEGWIVMRFWEHDLPDRVADDVESVVRERRSLIQ